MRGAQRLAFHEISFVTAEQGCLQGESTLEILALCVGSFAPAQQDHHRITLGRDEPERKHIFAATVVTFGYSLSEWAFPV
jgi:hypothetical protein